MFPEMDDYEAISSVEEAIHKKNLGRVMLYFTRYVQSHPKAAEIALDELLKHNQGDDRTAMRAIIGCEMYIYNVGSIELQKKMADAIWLDKDLHKDVLGDFENPNSKLPVETAQYIHDKLVSAGFTEEADNFLEFGKMRYLPPIERRKTMRESYLEGKHDKVYRLGLSAGDGTSIQICVENLEGRTAEDVFGKSKFKWYPSVHVLRTHQNMPYMSGLGEFMLDHYFAYDYISYGVLNNMINDGSWP